MKIKRAGGKGGGLWIREQTSIAINSCLNFFNIDRNF